MPSKSKPSKMPSEMVRSETTPDGVLLLTLDDPETRNALGGVLMGELLSEVKRFATGDELRCLVITGAGTAFSSGANVKARAQRIADAERAQEQGQATSSGPTPWELLDPVFTRESAKYDGPEIMSLLYNLPKPSIAAVNGPAYGLGCGIALACDIRVAGESARFSEAFVRTGLVPADGSTWLLPKLIGPANALWMQYSGDPVGAEEALRIGLVNAVTTDDELRDKAVEMATRLANGAGFAQSLIKQLVHQGYEQDFATHLRLATKAQYLARDTHDYKEGARAFAEKRTPRFEGR